MVPRLFARFRLPPFLPAYALLCAVLLYAGVFLWLGVTRLNVIAHFTESTARSAATMRTLDSLLNTITEIEAAGHGYALSRTDDYLQSVQRGRERVAPLLAQLRDSMRDDSAKLAMVENLVPLIAEHAALAASTLEHRRNASPDAPYDPLVEHRDKQSADQIRTVIAAIETREQDRLDRDGETLAAAISDARRDLYVMAGLTLLLALALFRAVKRLKAFLPFLPSDSTLVPPRGLPVAARASDAATAGLLRDALQRIRLAATAAIPGSIESGRLDALGATTERALGEHAQLMRQGRPLPSEPGIVQVLANLASLYTRESALVVKATIDQNLRIDDPAAVHLLHRCAEWALETITPRKRAGEVSLQLAASGGDIYLRVAALPDQPDLPMVLTPRESETANVLRQCVAALGGRLLMQESATGFNVSVALPAQG